MINLPVCYLLPLSGVYFAPSVHDPVPAAWSHNIPTLCLASSQRPEWDGTAKIVEKCHRGLKYWWTERAGLLSFSLWREVRVMQSMSDEEEHQNKHTNPEEKAKRWERKKEHGFKPQCHPFSSSEVLLSSAAFRVDHNQIHSLFPGYGLFSAEPLQPRHKILFWQIRTQYDGNKYTICITSRGWNTGETITI